MKEVARRGRNPRSGAEIRIAAARTVGFRPAKELKAALAAGLSSSRPAGAGAAER
jgi:nucleoid DNA-binding protein